MASELGLNPKKARRAGLLHDIGKGARRRARAAPRTAGHEARREVQGKTRDMQRHRRAPRRSGADVASGPHRQVCDAISGARPGARREIVEAYIKRLNDLEQLAMSYPGVLKTYAIQAGRELRVIVGADKIDDAETEKPPPR